jgi:hypothetical protein
MYFNLADGGAMYLRNANNSRYYVILHCSILLHGVHLEGPTSTVVAQKRQTRN